MTPSPTAVRRTLQWGLFTSTSSSPSLCSRGRLAPAARRRGSRARRDPGQSPGSGPVRGSSPETTPRWPCQLGSHLILCDKIPSSIKRAKGPFDSAWGPSSSDNQGREEPQDLGPRLKPAGLPSPHRLSPNPGPSCHVSPHSPDDTLPLHTPRRPAAVSLRGRAGERGTQTCPGGEPDEAPGAPGTEQQL